MRARQPDPGEMERLAARKLAARIRDASLRKVGTESMKARKSHGAQG
jgi:hypothetical protein